MNNFEWVMMRNALGLCALVATILLLVGCASEPGTRRLLDRLEFDEGECGVFELSGTVDLNPVPLMSSNTHLKLVKQKPCPGGT
jgi:hypothetical protein